MRGALLNIVLSSVCMFHAGCDIPIQLDFDVQKISGKWYPIALVMYQHSLKEIEIVDNIIQLSDNGDLHITVHYYLNGVCGSNEAQLLRTDEPGEFTVPGGLSTMRVVEIDYGSYCIFHVTAASNSILHLYSRKPKVSDAVRKKYMNRVTSMGFLADNIHYEKRVGHCP